MRSGPAPRLTWLRFAGILAGPPTRAPMTDALGRLRSALAGRYVVARELGAGGMATVYLAEEIEIAAR